MSSGQRCCFSFDVALLRFSFLPVPHHGCPRALSNTLPSVAPAAFLARASICRPSHDAGATNAAH